VAMLSNSEAGAHRTSAAREMEQRDGRAGKLQGARHRELQAVPSRGEPPWMQGAEQRVHSRGPVHASSGDDG
jgi:hypothetical protein